MNLRVFRSAEDLRKGLRESCLRAASTSLVPSILFGGSGLVESAISIAQDRSNILVTMIEDPRSSDIPGNSRPAEVTWVNPADESGGGLVHAPFDLAAADLEAVRSAHLFFEEVARRSRRFIVVDDRVGIGTPPTEVDLAGLESMEGLAWTFAVQDVPGNAT